MTETPRENLALEGQIQELKALSQLVRLEKDGEEFFFDGTDLNPDTEEKLRQMLAQGWQITTTESLPPFLPARKKQIKDMGLVESDWGYKKAE